jgi:adenine phosphoribosyltransferase
MLERLKKSLEAAPIVRKGDYDYFVHPITDGVPRMDPMVLAETLDAIKEVGDFHCDVILAAEAMGIPLAVPLSLELGIPYTVVRKRRYDRHVSWRSSSGLVIRRRRCSSTTSGAEIGSFWSTTS